MVKSNIPQDDSVNHAHMERKLQDALSDLESLKKHEHEIEKQLSLLTSEKAKAEFEAAASQREVEEARKATSKVTFQLNEDKVQREKEKQHT